MNLDSEEVSKVFEARQRASDLDELRVTYAELTSRALPWVSVPYGGEWGDANRLGSYALAYRQVILRRAIALFDGSLHALFEKNPYSMVVAIRAFFETTAALGYLHSRLASFAAGTVAASQVDADIMAQILGTKDPSISRAMPPKQIMKMLDYADRSINRSIIGSRAEEHAMLRESYDHLSEFAHPNFHSNKLAFDLDKTARRFVFHAELRDEAFAMIGYLLLASSLYVPLHDAIGGLVPKSP